MKTYTFGIRDTPAGATAWVITPSGRRQEKRFLNGYCSGHHSAKRWIDDQIGVIRQCELEDRLEGRNRTPANIIREDV